MQANETQGRVEDDAVDEMANLREDSSAVRRHTSVSHLTGAASHRYVEVQRQ